MVSRPEALIIGDMGRVVVHPEDLRRFHAKRCRVCGRKDSIPSSIRFLHKDGAYRWIREETKVIRDAAGEPVEVIGYWTDVTERKRMEAALRQV